jgi:hypothetical protein
MAIQIDQFTVQYEVNVKQTNARLFSNESGYDIPYNQRNYVWDDECIEKYIRDIDDVYEGKISFLTFGTLYFLVELKNSNYRTTIWDGQQRVITHYIFLSAIYQYVSNICEKYEKEATNIKKNSDSDSDEKKNYVLKDVIRNCKKIIGKLENYLFKKEYLWSHEEKLNVQNENIKISKINSIYEKDNIILQLLSNRKLKKNVLHLCKQEDNNYVCKNCDKTYKTINKAIEHLLICQKDNSKIKIYIEKNIDPQDKMIYAYFRFIDHLEDSFNNDISNYQLDNFNRLLAIFEEQIPHEQFICKGIECASILFDLLNNRGKKLTECDIIRNSIVRELPQNKKQEYFNKLESIISFSKNYKMAKRCDNVFRLIIELANGEFDISCSLLKSSENMMKKNDYMKIFKEMNNNKELLENIKNNMNDDNFGKLVQTEIIWDIFHYIISPFYKKICKNGAFTDNKIKKYMNKIYEIIVCYQIRTCIIRNLSNIQKKYVEIGNEILSHNFDGSDDDVEEIIDVIRTFIRNNLLKEDEYLVEKMSIHNMKRQYSFKILMYYLLKKSSNAFNYHVDEIDVEHICPKNTKNNEKLINHIGNLTLFEKGNNHNGLKGNRCLKDKEYYEKRGEYKKSCIPITKDLAKKYTKWDDTNIKERSIEICKFIDEKSSEILNI